MKFRRQLPVYSPLPAGALLSGAGGLVSGGGARRAVVEWLERTYETRGPLLTASGTGALTLAIRAATGERRPAVALPAWGCYDLVTAALGAGVEVRWYDLDPVTLGPEWRSFERALAGEGDRPGAAAAVLAHFYGVPVDMKAAGELAARHGALVIEDAAQGVGGRIGARPLGSFGDLAVLSFGRGKGLTGCGGGALLVHTAAGQAALERTDRALDQPRGGARALVTAAAQWMLARPATYAIPSSLPFLRLGETVFREPEPVRGLPPVAAGILARTIAEVEAESAARARNAAWLLERIGGVGTVPVGGIGTPGWLRLPLLLEGGMRTRADTRAARALGIMPGYPKVLNALGVRTDSDERFPGATQLVRQLVTVPVHGRVSATDLEELASWLAGQENS